MTDGPHHAVVGGGTPSLEEAVAIAAALDALWPRPVMASTSEVAPAGLRWRFSGRWWSAPSISRRDRPWVGPAR